MAPDLVQVYHKNRSSDVVFLSITEESSEVARRFARAYGIEWPICCDARHFLEDWLDDYSYPGLFIIGPDGKICWNDGGARQHHSGRIRFGIHELDAQIDRIAGRLVR